MKSLRNLSLVRVATATVACLSVLSMTAQTASAAEHAVHTVTCSAFNNQTMKDGDKIRITSERGGCQAHEIRIKLVLGSGITWWKGAGLFKKDSINDYLPLCSLQDGQKEVSGTVDLETFRTRNFVLSKAKAFGVRTNMYFVEDAPRAMKGGHTYTFTWTKD